MSAVDPLTVVIKHQDEWPLRVGEFIVDLAQWYAAHPALSEFTADDIAAFLAEVVEAQFVVHGPSICAVDRSAAGRTEHAVNTSVDFDNLRRTLASATFERYALCDAA